MKYANLIIDNKSDKTDRLYTYVSTEGASVGSKVYVPFARGSRLREAYIESLIDNVSEEIKSRLRNIDHVDDEISLSEEMMRTAIWMKKRYICRYIDAISCFTPVGSKAKRRARANPVLEREVECNAVYELTDEQKSVLDDIELPIKRREHARFLLHGITGSGKTEIYLRAVENVLTQGRNAIILVPEISLTSQITDRFTGRFGNEAVAVFHSKLTAGQRYDQWKRVRDGDVHIVIGARSAVFAPLEDIGLIVIDEEHEATYKSDHTPKYDTVEVAIKRGADRANNAVVIMGSATPSVTSYSRSQEGIFKLLKLTERYNKVELPGVDIVDMRQELREGNKGIVSSLLYDSIKENLEKSRQIMILQNRRGYATFISCRECGCVLKCPHCGVSLTYHKKENKAVCHYCGFNTDVPDKCPECDSKYIKYFGSGTEKVEEVIKELFSTCNVERLDLDTVQKRGELEKKLKAFKTGKTHILIGTQLIAKGLDFKNVGLVGIIAADVSLNIPDFRSSERTFQLITQAAGRAGRGNEKGRVVIQTYNPEHYAVECAASQDYEAFYSSEIEMRRYMLYPPYSDIFQILFMSNDEKNAQEGSEIWHEKLRELFGEDEAVNILCPQQAYQFKINENYRYALIIKCPKGKRKKYTELICKVRENEIQQKNKKYIVVVDINPYTLA